MFSFGDTFLASIYSISKDVFSGVKPLIFLVFGLSLGYFILEEIVFSIQDALERHQEEREIERERLEFVGEKLRKRWERRRAEAELPEVEEA
jgi:hypothetical protein